LIVVSHFAVQRGQLNDPGPKKVACIANFACSPVSDVGDREYARMIAMDLGPPPWVAAAERYSGELATISYRVAVTAGDDCPDKKPLIGLSIHDLSQYQRSDQQAVKSEYGFRGFPLVMAVAQGGPAAQSGVQAGESIIAVNGEDLRDKMTAAGSYRNVSLVWEKLDAAAQQGPVRLTLLKGDSQITVSIQPVVGCQSRFELGSSSDIDAVTSEAQIIVNIGALEFARGDDEAAAIISHELGHDILNHEGKGTLGPHENQRDGGLRIEEDADRLSIRLLKRAGYDPNAIVRFWTRFLSQFPKNRHDSALQARIYAIQTELDRDMTQQSDQ
jgi:beta-barrel assembly-enhancing protease